MISWRMNATVLRYGYLIKYVILKVVINSTWINECDACTGEKNYTELLFPVRKHFKYTLGLLFHGKIRRE